MSQKLIELEDYSITDAGEAVVTRDFLVKKALSGEPLEGYLAEFHEDIKRYNYRTPGSPIPFWEEGELEGPSEETYQWTIPEEYQSIDIWEYVLEKFMEKGFEGEEYEERIAYELSEMEKRGFFPFIRCIIYVLDVFRQNEVVWGVGRGSACASLLFYVIGATRVDPIEYEIPIEEFLK